MPAEHRWRTLRLLVLVPVVLCVLGWVWSFRYTERISYAGPARGVLGQIAVGEVDLLWGPAMPRDPTTSTPAGWSHVHMHPDWEAAEFYTGLPAWEMPGLLFFVGRHSFLPGGTTVLLVTRFWLLTLAALVVAALVWWATRPRRVVPGFPVHAADHART